KTLISNDAVALRRVSSSSSRDAAMPLPMIARRFFMFGPVCEAASGLSHPHDPHGRELELRHPAGRVERGAGEQVRGGSTTPVERREHRIRANPGRYFGDE